MLEKRRTLCLIGFTYLVCAIAGRVYAVSGFRAADGRFCTAVCNCASVARSFTPRTADFCFSAVR